MVLRIDRTTGQLVERCGPNPESAPPIDPADERALDVFRRRLNKDLRYHWMRDNRCWGIQQRNGRGEYETVFIAYDEDAQWEENHYPYMPLGSRLLEQFAESVLEFRFNTGDNDRDRLERDRWHDDRMARMNAEQDKQQTEAIAARLCAGVIGDPSGIGDHKRAARRLRASGPDDGTGWKEFFQVPNAAPVAKDDP